MRLDWSAKERTQMTLQQVVPVLPERRTAAPLPRAPQRLEDTGLDFGFVLELLVKVLFLRGQLRLPELSAHVKLPVGILDSVLALMRSERLCEMSRRGETEGAMLYTLTDAGRARAQDFLARSQYSGPAPVSLNAYIEQVQKQSILNMSIDRARVSQVFAGVVIKEELLNQFGAGMASGRAVLIYGPAGSGKT